MVKIGRHRIWGWGIPLPRKREEAKKILRSLAKGFGVNGLFFVRTKRLNYLGKYNLGSERIIVVEQVGSYKTPVRAMAYSFLHELVHYLQQHSFLFAPVFYEKLREKNGKWRKIPLTEALRLVVRAEKHADQKAIELAHELFGLELPLIPLSKKDVQEIRDSYERGSI